MNPMNFRSPFLFAFLLIGLGSGCAGPGKFVTGEGESAATESSVEIHYSLARNFYRLQISDRNGKVEGSSGVNDQAIEKRKIDKQKYFDFANRAEIIAREIAAANDPADLKECKTPYTLVLKRDGAITRKVTGCRSHDPDGKIGRLIQEGEFLFYSPGGSSPSVNQ